MGRNELLSVGSESLFFELLKAGLWEKDTRLLINDADMKGVFRLAENQSVVGLIAAGMEHISSVSITQDVSLSFATYTLQLEQRNKAMNLFLASLIENIRKAGIYAILVKGQGVAQCYDRPLWRACGDIDLLLSDTIFPIAKTYLSTFASFISREEPYERHITMTVNSWIVELHGSLRTGISRRIDKGIDDLQKEVFYDGRVRPWNNSDVLVLLPEVDIDVLFIFTHILKHFFYNGIGLRQICDWCRLLWTYQGRIDVSLLDNRLHEMGLVSEWKAFATLAVDYLGMPEEAMPLYIKEKKWKKKADRIMTIVLGDGNFGQNRDTSYAAKHHTIFRKMISLLRHTCDCARLLFIFPLNSLKSWGHMFVRGIKNLGIGDLG